MPVMIWIAALTEAAISNWPDMGILLAIQFVNASLGYYEITKAGKKSIPGVIILTPSNSGR
jgi:H+-transporting ATPase